MNDKSHVGMDVKLCPVCGKKHTVGILLDKRLRNSLERENVTGWELCDEHRKLYDDGFIALVGVDPERSSPGADGGLKLEDAYRTGDIVHLRLEVWGNVFDMPVPEEDGKPIPMMFVDPEVVQKMQEMQAHAEDSD